MTHDLYARREARDAAVRCARHAHACLASEHGDTHTNALIVHHLIHQHPDIARAICERLTPTRTEH